MEDEDARVITMIMILAMIEEPSQRSVREIWYVSETHPHHKVPKIPPISIQLIAAGLCLLNYVLD